MNKQKNFETNPKRDFAFDLLTKRYKRYKLKITMADAAILRRILKECMEETKQIKNWGESGFELSSEAEIRFFHEAFGIDLRSYMSGVKNQEEYEKRMTQLAILINEKIRPESELL